MKKLLAPGFFLLTFLLMFLTSCATAPAQQESERLNVTVSILPEKYFVERIGGDRVQVNVMVGPGENYHTYEPKPEQMASLSQADIYFAIGIEFEGAWLEKFQTANPDMVIVDVSANVEKIPLEDDHSDQGLDPHIWTSPEIGKTIAQNITHSLIEIDPQNRDLFQMNLEELLADIGLLQTDITGELKTIKNHQFLVFHPAWGYFAQEFGLEEVAIEVGGTEPSASELSAIITTALEKKIQVIFAQPEFSTQIADYIASEINGKVVLITPLAEDWLDNLRLVAQSLSENL